MRTPFTPMEKTKRSRGPMAPLLASSVLALTLGLTNAKAADTTLDHDVYHALAACKQLSQSCASETSSAVGVLVFPHVVKADFIIGGSGGKGALLENGKITGYYDIGSASAGLQAGVESSHQIYVFRTPQALDKLKQGNDWKVGATANAVLINTSTNARDVSGQVLAYVFNAKGLEAGISLDTFDVWKEGQPRPSQNYSQNNQ